MELFDHQKTGIEFLKERKKAILGDDMGLGKTRQAILAAGESADGDILIVCPASLKLNWKREIGMVYPEDGVYIFGMDELPVSNDTAWHIINYDVLEKYWDTLEIHDWDTVILDESHYIKGDSKRAQLSLKLTRKAKQVYLLSGTIVQNRPIELWNQLLAIEHPLTRSQTDTPYWAWINFGKRYCAGFRAQYGGRKAFWDFTGASHLDELRRKLDGFYLRRKKSEVLDMPDKIRTMMPVSITPEWRAKYDTAFEDYLQWLQDHPEVLEEKNLANILMVQHLVELSKVKQVASLAKVETVADQINELIDAGEKVVVFTVYKETLSVLKKLVKRCRKVELTGETSMKKRQEAVDQFQNDPETKVFFGNIEAAGVGITLTAASNVVFADLDWNPANHDQAEDRCHRIGQTGTVNVYYFIAEDTVDEDVLIMLEKKREIVDAIQEGKTVRDQGRGSIGDMLKSIGQKHKIGV